MKQIKVLFAVFLICILAVTLVACGEKGDQGPQGEKGDQGVQGPQGEKGDQGIGIESILLDEEGNLVITFGDGTTQVLDHSWEKVCTIEPAKCTSDGKDLYSCADCGLARVVTIPQTGHTYVETIVEPNCLEQGYTLHECECGDNYKDTFIQPIVDHDFSDADTCKNCKQNIADVAIECYDLSATANDNVYGYVVAPYADHRNAYHVYIKGSGETKEYPYSYGESGLFENETDRTITRFYISDGVTGISEGLLAGYEYVSWIEVDPDNTMYKSVGGDLYTKDGKTLVQHPPQSFGSEFIIPDGVTTIGKYAFAESRYHMLVVIPNSVTEIGVCAFWHSDIVWIIIPESVIDIKEGAFYSCERLIAVSIPNSVKTIGPSAFSLCYKLSSVHYAGTEEQWSEIDIHFYGNGCLEDADRKYNSILVVGEVMVGQAKVRITIIKKGTQTSAF